MKSFLNLLLESSFNMGNSTKKTLTIIIQSCIIFLFVAVIVVAFFRTHFSQQWRWIFFGAGCALTVIQCFRLKCPLLLIDRIFSNYPGKQILLAFVIFIITFDLALCLFPRSGLRLAFIDFVNPKVLLEEALDSYEYEIDTIHQTSNFDSVTFIKRPGIAKSRSDYFMHGLVYLLGLIVFNGLLIATINRFMATRAERFKKGANTYSSLRDHYVIIGYGNSCVPIIRNILNRNETGAPSYFLILSNQSPDAIRLSILTQLRAIEKRIVIYSGDMDSRTHLNRLNIEKAKEVVILGEGNEPGRDSKNLECAKMIKAIRLNESHDNVLHVSMQLDKPTSYSTIKRITIPKQYYMDDSGNEVTYIRPFNFYENWARLLWGTFHLNDYQSLDRGLMAEDGHHVHLVIAGFNEMGVALLLEALRVCHYPNYNEETEANKTYITVVDPDMDKLLPRFESQYPYLHQITDIHIEYKSCRIEDEAMRRELDELAQHNDILLTVAICHYDSDDSLSAALTLPDSLYYQVADNKIVPNNHTQILVRQEIRKGLADLLDEENGKFSNVKVFGTLDKGVDDELLDDQMAIIINAYYHFKYNLLTTKDFFELIREDKAKALEEAAKSWIALSEDKRFANRYQIEIYSTYRTYRAMLEQNPEVLYQTEHLRWCAERSITGYRDLRQLNLKSETYQIHRCIVPYHELNELDKDKDRDVLNIMDKVVDLAQTLTEKIV